MRKQILFSFIIKFLGLLSSVGITILIVKFDDISGSSTLGIIAYLNAIINLILIFSLIGYRLVLAKNISIYLNTKTVELIKPLLYGGFTIFSVVIILILLLFYLLQLSFDFIEIDQTRPNIIFLIFFIVLIVGYSRLYSGALNGLNKIFFSNISDRGLRPILLIISISFFYLLSGLKIDAFNYYIFYFISALIIFLILFFLWTNASKHFPSGRFLIKKEHLKMGGNVTLIKFLAIFNSTIDIFLLKFFEIPFSEIGVYSIAVRISTLSIFFNPIIDSYLTPKLSVYYQNKNFQKIMSERILIWKYLSLFIFIFLSLYFVFGDYFIELFWGRKFLDAFKIAGILIIGKLIGNLSIGSGTLLLISGKEGLHFKITVFAFIFNLTLT